MVVQSLIAATIVVVYVEREESPRQVYVQQIAAGEPLYTYRVFVIQRPYISLLLKPTLHVPSADLMAVVPKPLQPSDSPTRRLQGWGEGDDKSSGWDFLCD